jgi:hypothetical protein
MTYPNFNVGETLRAADMNAVGLWLVKTVTVGVGVSSVPVTDVFSADYDNYQIIYEGGVCNANVSIGCQLGSTTTGYQYSAIFNQYNAPTPVGLGQTNSAIFQEAGRGSAARVSASFYLFSPFLSTYTGFRNFGLDYLASAGYNVNGSGFLDNTTSYTAFTLIPASGATLTGGTIRVYGYKN